jgi:hypothetical protein
MSSNSFPSSFSPLSLLFSGLPPPAAAAASARFISEFGFQSLPSYETYSQVLSAEDWNRNSDLLNFRQRHDGGNAQIEFMIDKHFKLPPASAPDGNLTTQRKVFDDFLYLTQVRLGGGEGPWGHEKEGGGEEDHQEERGSSRRREGREEEALGQRPGQGGRTRAQG